VELYSTLFKAKKIVHYLDTLAQLQEALGELNDHVVAIRLLEEVAQGSPPKVVARISEEIEHRHSTRLKKLRKAWKLFSKQKDFWN
ncbi:MAG: CHAD domain-containing protein, partial [Gallionellaceae bacterium]|nr:CHAD domain-containing protein [Gallionellaceae bacterium]